MRDTRILIVEDEPLIAEDIRDYLEKLDYRIIGVANSGEEALDMLANRQVDLALLDIYIEGTIDGIEVAEVINKTYKIPFLFLTSLSDSHTIERAKHTYPYGYIVKPFDERDLSTNIEMAKFKHANEKNTLIPSLDRINLSLKHPLSEKEYQIALDISQGLINREMAEKHFISINTVKTHIKHLYVKLDVNNRASLIRKISGSI